VSGLQCTLGLRSVVLFGLAHMTPLIVLGTFGVLAAKTGGAAPSAYLLALVAMVFTAYAYGRMAAAFPVAGSAYTYARRAIDARVGFLVGWAVLLDYFFLPMVIWLIGGAYLSAQFPETPSWAFSVRHAFGISAEPFEGTSATVSGIAGGAALAAYSFLGFDAVTTLTEETIEPQRTIPRAILLVTLIGGGIFVLVA
jgi:putrescine importer